MIRQRPPRRNNDGWIRCHTCGVHSPPEMMPRKADSPDGYAGQCRACRRPAYQRWWTKLASDDDRYAEFLRKQRERNKAKRTSSRRGRVARMRWALGVLFGHGYTQSRIAREAGVAENSVYKWKNGQVSPKPGGVERVERLAASLILPVSGDD